MDQNTTNSNNQRSDETYQQKPNEQVNSVPPHLGFVIVPPSNVGVQQLASHPLPEYNQGVPSASANPGSSPNGCYNKLVDPESLEVKNFSFNDQSIRRGFIRKVYLILMAQLMVTFGMVSLFIFHMPTQEFAINNLWIFYVMLFTVLISTLFMGCFEELLRKTPTNFIFLGLFTTSESVIVAYVTTMYDKNVVIMAVGITAAICLALSIFAMQSKYDFTACGGVLLTFLVILILFGIVLMFFPGETAHMVYSSFGAILFSFYLIYDTQLMMGGDHKYSISPEEYIFASINLYLDIINLFLYILRILGSKK